MTAKRPRCVLDALSWLLGPFYASKENFVTTIVMDKSLFFKSKRVSRRWYIRFPGAFHALGPVEFDKPVGERKVREWTREWAELERLPAGFECWPAQ